MENADISLCYSTAQFVCGQRFYNMILTAVKMRLKNQFIEGYMR